MEKTGTSGEPPALFLIAFRRAALPGRKGEVGVGGVRLEEEVPAGDPVGVGDCHEKLEIRRAVAVGVALHPPDVAGLVGVSELTGDIAERIGSDEAESLIAGGV